MTWSRGASSPDAPARNDMPRRNMRLIGELRVGDELEVFWPLDNRYYPGRVGARLPSGRHRVVYLDGEVEDLRLAAEQWRFRGRAARRVRGDRPRSVASLPPAPPQAECSPDSCASASPSSASHVAPPPLQTPLQADNPHSQPSNTHSSNQHLHPTPPENHVLPKQHDVRKRPRNSNPHNTCVRHQPFHPAEATSDLIDPAPLASATIQSSAPPSHRFPTSTLPEHGDISDLTPSKSEEDLTPNISTTTNPDKLAKTLSLPRDAHRITENNTRVVQPSKSLLPAPADQEHRTPPASAHQRDSPPTTPTFKPTALKPDADPVPKQGKPSETISPKTPNRASAAPRTRSSNKNHKIPKFYQNGSVHSHARRVDSEPLHSPFTRLAETSPSDTLRSRVLHQPVVPAQSEQIAEPDSEKTAATLAKSNAIRSDERSLGPAPLSTAPATSPYSNRCQLLTKPSDAVPSTDAATSSQPMPPPQAGTPQAASVAAAQDVAGEATRDREDGEISDEDMETTRGVSQNHVVSRTEFSDKPQTSGEQTNTGDKKKPNLANSLIRNLKTSKWIYARKSSDVGGEKGSAILQQPSRSKLLMRRASVGTGMADCGPKPPAKRSGETNDAAMLAKRNLLHISGKPAPERPEKSLKFDQQHVPKANKSAGFSRPSNDESLPRACSDKSNPSNFSTFSLRRPVTGNQDFDDAPIPRTKAAGAYLRGGRFQPNRRHSEESLAPQLTHRETITHSATKKPCLQPESRPTTDPTPTLSPSCQKPGPPGAQEGTGDGQSPAKTTEAPPRKDDGDRAPAMPGKVCRYGLRSRSAAGDSEASPKAASHARDEPGEASLRPEKSPLERKGPKRKQACLAPKEKGKTRELLQKQALHTSPEGKRNTSETASRGKKCKETTLKATNLNDLCVAGGASEKRLSSSEAPPAKRRNVGDSPSLKNGKETVDVSSEVPSKISGGEVQASSRPFAPKKLSPDGDPRREQGATPKPAAGKANEYSGGPSVSCATASSADRTGKDNTGVAEENLAISKNSKGPEMDSQKSKIKARPDKAHEKSKSDAKVTSAQVVGKDCGAKAPHINISNEKKAPAAVEETEAAAGSASPPTDHPASGSCDNTSTESIVTGSPAKKSASDRIEVDSTENHASVTPGALPQPSPASAEITDDQNGREARSPKPASLQKQQESAPATSSLSHMRQLEPTEKRLRSFAQNRLKQRSKLAKAINGSPLPSGVTDDPHAERVRSPLVPSCKEPAAKVNSVRRDVDALARGVEDLFRENKAAFSELHEGVDAARSSITSMGENIQTLKNKLADVPSKAEYADMWKLGTKGMKEQIVAAVQSVVSDLKRDLESCLVAELDGVLRNLSTEMQRESAALISKAIDNAMSSSGLSQDADERRNSNGGSQIVQKESGGSVVVSSLRERMAADDTTRSVMKETPEGRTRKVWPVATARTDIYASSKNSHGVSGGEYDRHESVRARCGVLRSSSVEQMRKEALDGRSAMRAGSGNVRAEDGKQGNLGETRRFEDENCEEDRYCDSGETVGEGANRSSARGKYSRVVNAGRLEADGNGEEGDVMRGGIRKRGGDQSAMTKARELLGTCAVAWFLKGGCRNVAPLNERDEPVSERWVLKAAQRCLEGVVEALFALDDYSSVMKASWPPLNSGAAEIDWLVSGPSDGSLRKARGNYAHWDPPLHDFEWRSDRRAMRAVGAYVMASEAALVGEAVGQSEDALHIARRWAAVGRRRAREKTRPS